MSKTITWREHVHRPFQDNMVSDKAERHAWMLGEYVPGPFPIGGGILKEVNLKLNNAGGRGNY